MLKNSLNELKHKILKPNYFRTQHYNINVNTRRPKKYTVDEENHDWKEDYITFPQEWRLAKVKVETEKVNKI